jgi:thiol:disulfide interchange protein DsbD
MKRFVLLLLFCILPAQAGLLPDRPAPNEKSSIADVFAEKRGPDDFLPPDQAFKLRMRAQDKQTVIADFDVAPGYYLYKSRISFTLNDAKTSEIAKVELPTGEIKEDPNFGKSEVYHHPFQVKILLQHHGAVPPTIALTAGFQGCSEKGLCYTPMKKVFEIGLADAVSTSAPTSDIAEPDKLGQALASGKLWLVALLFFGVGLGLSFTPCVYPMIPILSGIIVRQSAHPSRAHAFNLSLAYTLGMAITYALAGVAAGLSGHLISNALQNPWALGFGAVLFVFLALSMFDIYELRLPSVLETKVADVTNRIKGGRFIGVFAMGALSALLVSPCVAAPLAGALLYIGKTHDVILGGVALFAMAMGMGMPLLAVGLSAGKVLPKAGQWMTVVRNLFGVLMLAMAIWLIAPVIPVAVQMGLWALLLIGLSVFLHALDGLPAQSSNALKVGKGLGVVALITGVALLLGALSGSRNLMQPLSGVFSVAGSVKSQDASPFKQVKNLAELDTAIQAAKGRYVMLDFYADWCAACKEYERTTFADARVRKQFDRVALLQADVTKNTDDDKALLAHFGFYGPPGIVFFDQTGKQITPLKVAGYQAEEQFLGTLARVFASKDGACPKLQEC